VTGCKLYRKKGFVEALKEFVTLTFEISDFRLEVLFYEEDELYAFVLKRQLLICNITFMKFDLAVPILL
jgi:hypothetical protein